MIATQAAGKSRLILQAAAIAGGWVPLTIAAGQSVALKMDSLTASAAAYSFLIAAGWGVSMVSLPIMGSLGDNAVRRGIDRRILIAVGGVSMLLCFALMGSAGSVITFSAIWLVAQIPTALIVTSASSRLANEAPVNLRAWAAAAAGVGPILALALGAITTLVFSDMPSALFIAPAVVGAILLIPSLLIHPLPDRQMVTGSVNRSARFFPWALLIAVALAFSGLAVGRIYLVPLIEYVSADLSTEQVTASASVTLLVATMGALLGTVVAGRLMRGGGRSLGTFGWFSLASAVPLALFIFVTTIDQLIVGGAVLGFVIGAINASIFGVYLHRYSHHADPGRILGLIIAAETVPYVIVPLAAAISQTATSSELIPFLFLGGALMSIGAGVLTLTKLRHSQ